MGKSNHFFGQPLYGQLIKLLDKEKVYSQLASAILHTKFEKLFFWC